MYTVIQQTETEETFGVKEFESYSGACAWIVENEANYPESSFWVEGANA